MSVAASSRLTPSYGVCRSSRPAPARTTASREICASSVSNTRMRCSAGKGVMRWASRTRPASSSVSTNTAVARESERIHAIWSGEEVS